MKKWLRRIRGAVLMGLTWAVVWVPVGLLISMIVDPDGSMDEPWILVGAYPGFLSAVVFSMVIWIAERRRRFDELSPTRVGAWGAVAGLLVGMVPFVAGSNSTNLPTWLLMFAIIGPITLLSAVSAGGSLALARRAEKLNFLDARADVAKVGVTGG
ncbi:MAG: hypothetical protein Q8Q85_15765 [Gemmatimonadales bacterium]|nr:hypothetical protein [Gemmatimonadales bacterium]